MPTYELVKQDWAEWRLLKTASYKTQFAWHILDIHYISEAPFLTTAYKANRGGFSSCILPLAFCLMTPVPNVLIEAYEKNFGFWTVFLQNQMKAISVWNTTMSTIFCPKYILYPRWKLKKKCWFFWSTNSNANTFVIYITCMIFSALYPGWPSTKWKEEHRLVYQPVRTVLRSSKVQARKKST